MRKSYTLPIGEIRKRVPQQERYVILAEEASELAQAALKVYRLHSNGIPTPIQTGEAFDNLIEELSDVILSAYVCGIGWDSETMSEKAERWLNRIKEAENSRSKQAT